MSIAFLGPRGTNSEEAALMFGGPDAELVAFSSIPALTSAVETGLADSAILPIENSIEGPVSTTLDLLIHETGLKICSEVVVPIKHVLVVQPGVKLEEIQTIISHPQGLAQCRRFLERFLPNANQVAWLSTAGAVQEAVEGDDRTRAAIGPLRAHELYGGEILAHDIQDVRGNLTRFVALANEDPAPTGDDKTSLGLMVRDNVPGILVEILKPFADNQIQLIKIESRPAKGWIGDHVFILDFLGHRTDPTIAQVLEDLKQSTRILKIFGSFPRYPVENYRELFSSQALL